LTIFYIHLINKCDFSWKTRNCLGDPKLLNGSVYCVISSNLDCVGKGTKWRAIGWVVVF